MTGWRDEFRRDPMGEMTPAEFASSLLFVVVGIMALLAWLWIAPACETKPETSEVYSESR